MSKAPHVACYGWADAHAGSVAGANYILLRELLRRQVSIDFFADPLHVRRPETLDSSHFTYVPVTPPQLARTLPHKLGSSLSRAASPVVRQFWRRAYLSAARPRHDKAPYDICLSLGTWPAFTLPGIPTIAWLQAPFHTELQAIRNIKESIEHLNGLRFYLSLVAYYRWAQLTRRRMVDGCSDVIFPSAWSRQAFAEDTSATMRLHAIPYPIDLNLFQPNGRTVDLKRPLILSIGRLDPRKRLDLLLAGFSRVVERLPEARLLVVGRPGYAPRQLALFEMYAGVKGIEYRRQIPRSEVIPLLQRATVVVQPSMNENFGSAVAEALSCGTPVVVGRSNGTAEYISSSSAVFERYSPDSVATAILTVIERRRQWPERVQHEARHAAEASFAPTKVANSLLEVIEAARAN